MMRIALKVEYDDGSEAAVVAAAPDLIAFERHFDKPMTVFADSPRVEWMLWLAWTALHRQGKTADAFDPWTEKISGIVFGEQQGDIVPLESSQPTG